MSRELPRWATMGTGDSRRRQGDWVCSSASRQSMPSRSRPSRGFSGRARPITRSDGAGVARRLDQSLGVDELAVGGRIRIGKGEPQAMHGASRAARCVAAFRDASDQAVSTQPTVASAGDRSTFDFADCCRATHTAAATTWTLASPQAAIQDIAETARQPGPRERGVSRREAKCLWQRRRKRRLKPRSCATSRKACCRSSRSASTTGWAPAWSSETTSDFIGRISLDDIRRALADGTAIVDPTLGWHLAGNMIAAQPRCATTSTDRKCCGRWSIRAAT